MAQESELTEVLFETDRLILRRVQPGDLELFKKLFCDPGMMRYLGEPWTEEETESTMNEWWEEWGRNNYYYGVILRKDTSEAIGIAGFTEDTHPEEKGMEFSWFILPEHQKNGFASEITRGLKQYVFGTLKKERLFGETHPDNPASNRVLQKLGFKNMGIRNQSYDFLPGFDRQVIWEIRREDWESEEN